MKFSDLRCGALLKFRLRPLKGDFVPKADIAAISANAGSGIYRVGQMDSSCLCALVNPAQAEDLNYHLHSRNARIITLSEFDPEGAFLATFRMYNGDCREMGKLEIGIREDVFESFRKNKRDIAEMLKKEFIAGDGEGTRFAILPSAALPRSAGENVDFAFVGRSRILPVARGEYMGRAMVMARKPMRWAGDLDGALLLAAGAVEFKDCASAAAIGAMAAAQLKSLYQDNSSYLAAWDKYNAAEGEALLRRARKIKAIPYSRCEEQATTCALYCSGPIPEALSENDTVDIAEQIPPYLDDPEMTWEEFFNIEKPDDSASVEDDSDNRPSRQRRKNDENNRVDARGLKVVHIDRVSGLINVAKPENGRLPPNLKITLSLLGDATQVKRRARARQMVLSGRAQMPCLGPLIEENGEPSLPARPHSAINALTPFVKDKIFPKGHTLNQEEAIAIALNTPDIALIQGPPGTGKTTVITAIIERLNQLLDAGGAGGSILVSGFQHDAVNNLLGRLTINSLPPIKFGGKKTGIDGQKDTTQENWIRDWARDLAARMREKHPELREPEQFRKLDQAFNAYWNSPGEASEEAFLDCALALPAGLISGEIMDRAIRAKAALKSGREQADIKNKSELEIVARSLRVDRESYADDGLINARAAALILPSELLEPPEKDLLGQNPEKHAKGLDGWLEDAAKIRNRILEKLRMPQPYVAPRPKKEICDLYETIKKLPARGEDARAKALLEYLNDLENSPEANLRVLKEASLVYGATTQQSAGKEIRAAKTGENYGQPISYDTVIIDEAARSSPPDLLIPMTQARKRIILVGDQNQLPHIIDEDLARSLEEGEETAGLASRLKESMFGYLFHRLQKLTEKDGIRRVITLDTQYRMHPLLGDFVSREFYDGVLKSGRHESEFAHNLPGTMGRPCAWLNVPNEAGPHCRSGFSLVREAEARAIARQLKQWLEAPGSEKLTFGVISFYRAQADLIEKEALRQGIYVEHGGKRLLAPQYGERQDRVRINTVDAFQGMEFDAVFLSLTRSWDLSRPQSLPPSIANEADETKRHARLFGHLMSKNRLCVALSRQERLLVVAGNAGMARHAESRAAVGELSRFLDLCEAKGAFL